MPNKEDTTSRQKKQCKEDGCTKQPHARGLCQTHYQKAKIRGDFTEKKCCVDGCERPFYAKDMCHRHCKQVNDKGFLYANPSRSRRDPLVFILKHDHVVVKLFNMAGDCVARTFVDHDDLWRVKKHKWHLTGRGYVETRHNKRLIKLHQFIMGRKNIDHADRNPLNNRKYNLRDATQSQQLMNVVRKRPNKTGYRGVGKEKSGRYTAGVSAYNEYHYLGMYDTAEEAAIAYNEGCLKYHGEFAVLNKIQL